MEQICEYDLCTGCSACQNICPHGAIVLLPDKNGELHPQINTQICVDCGICQSRCPVNDNVRMVMPVSCYAAWNSDAKERELSASGGIAAAMYKYVIEQLAGVVYGVAWNSVLRPEYVRVDSLADLERLKGSKYVQAFVDNIYQDVKKDLQHGRWVLFVGTPCQVAGLQNYLGKNKSNDRLLTCDLLCHGVPPYDYLKAELGTIPSPVLKKVINCRFRGNDQYNYCFSLWDDGKRLGICDGDDVELSSPYGRIRVKSRLTCKTKPGTIQMLHGYTEANVNLLIGQDHLDPYSGFPGFKSLRCQIRKIE